MPPKGGTATKCLLLVYRVYPARGALLRTLSRTRLLRMPRHGLLFLKRWAVWLYLVSLIIGYLVFPFTGPTVEHALADTIDEISVLLSGFIIGIAFFSNALRTTPAITSTPRDGAPATYPGK